MKQPRIIVDPEILAGHPVVEGTRIPVSLILNLLSHGYTFDRIKTEYPELNDAAVHAAVSYAEDRIKREEVFPL